MSHPKEWRPHELGRREFLRRSVQAALAVPGAAAILAACGRGTTPGARQSPAFELARQDNPVTLPLFEDNAAIGDDLQPEKNATLKIYNWPDYTYKKVLNEFCDKYDCKWQYTTFDTMDEAISKFRTGSVQFDLFFPEVTVVGKLVAAKLLQPLNLSYIPNLKANVWPQLRSPFYDLGPRYTVPYSVWTTGIAWRNDKVKDDIPALDNPYEILWDSRYRNKVHLINDYRDALGFALLKNGITDLNTEDPRQIELAKDDLIKLVEAVNPKFDSADYQDLPEGQAWLHQSWSGNMAYAQYYMPKGVPVSVLSYYWPPSDGNAPGTINNDTIGIPANAKNPVLAHLFLNHILEPENAIKNFSWIGYQPPLEALDPDRFIEQELVPSNLKSIIMRPEDFERGHEQLELRPEVDALWHRAWEQVQAGA